MISQELRLFLVDVAGQAFGDDGGEFLDDGERRAEVVAGVLDEPMVGVAQDVEARLLGRQAFDFLLRLGDAVVADQRVADGALQAGRASGRRARGSPRRRRRPSSDRNRRWPHVRAAMIGAILPASHACAQRARARRRVRPSTQRWTSCSPCRMCAVASSRSLTQSLADAVAERLVQHSADSSRRSRVFVEEQNANVLRRKGLAVGLRRLVGRRRFGCGAGGFAAAASPPNFANSARGIGDCPPQALRSVSD